MSIKRIKEVGTILLVASLSWFVWRLIPSTLNDVNFNTDYALRNPFLKGEYDIRLLSFLEIIKYLLLSFLLSVSMIFPFWIKKDFNPKMSYPKVFSLFTFTFFISCYLLDQTAKGAYLVNWLGDDFPYGWRLIFFHVLSPPVLYILVKRSLVKIQRGNIPFFFVIGLGTTILCYKPFDGHFMNVDTLRAVVASGYYNFFITLFLGLYFLMVSNYIEVDYN